MAVASPQTFRFRPRYRVIPWIVALLGLTMLGIGLGGGASGASRTFAIVAGAFGPLIALAYLRSPTWRLEVVVDDEGLTVRRGDEVRFRLAWTEVKEVVYSEQYPVAFLDGGEAERSLLVPGPGLSAPYRIERAEALVAFVRAHVPADKQRAVEAAAVTKAP